MTTSGIGPADNHQDGTQVEALVKPQAAVRSNQPFPSQDQVAAAAAKGRAEGVAGAYDGAAPGQGWASLAVGIFGQAWA